MRVVVADDSALMREGLARLLAEAGCTVIATASDGDGALREVALTHPDAVLLDIRMPPTRTDEGIQAAHRIKREYPDVSVLVLSQYLQSHYAMKLLQDSPRGVGYLLKDRVSDVAILVDALRRLADGETVLDPTIVTRLMRRPSATTLDKLTERERAILELMAEGRSNDGIAQRLEMSRRTVETHVRQIMQKLNLPNDSEDNRRVLAVLAWLREPTDETPR